MNKLIKMIISALLILCLALPLGACGKETAKKELPDFEDTDNITEFEVDWFVNVSYWKWPGEYGKDYLSDLLQRRTGAKINFQVSAGDSNTQIMTMIAGGTLPDIITCSDDIRYKMASGGYLWAYDDLIKKYSPELGEIVKQIPDIYDWYREYDQKVYGLPNYASSENYLKKDEKLNPNMAGVIRSDLYNKIGRPDISTPDAFLDALEQIKNKIGTYRGSELIPLQLYEFSTDGSPSMNALRGYFSVPFEDKDGHYIRHCDKEFQIYRFLNKAYNRGLLKIENFSDSRENINEKVTSGRVVSLFAAIQDFGTYMTSLYDSDNQAVYEPIIMKNYDGEDPLLADTSCYGYQTTSISTQAKRPDLCTKLITYLMSDQGQLEMLFGAQDETQYTINDKGNVVWTEGGNLWNAYAGGNAEAVKYYTLGFNLLTDYLRTRNYYAEATDQRSISTQSFYIQKPLQPYTYNGKRAILKSVPETEKKINYTKINAKINSYWGTQMVKIITAPSEEKARQYYDEGLQKEKEYGGEKLLAYQDECLQASKEMMGWEYAWPRNQKENTNVD